MRKIIYPPDTIVKLPNVFGDGSDGNVIISSDTTLTRDMFYNNLTIESGKVLNTNGYRVFVKGVLINKGTIRNNGSNASGYTGASGGAKGTTNGGGNGGNGSVGNGKSGQKAFNSLSNAGGNGGNAGMSSGGQGGQAISPPADAGTPREFIAALTGKLLGRTQNRPAVILRKNTNQSISSGVDTKITFETEDLDTDTMHDTITNNTRITINTPGLYLFNFLIRFAGNSTGIRYVQFKKNNATVNASRFTFFPNSNNEMTVSGSLILNCNTDDYIELEAYQNSGANLNIIAASGDWRDTQFQAVLLDDYPMHISGGPGGGGGAAVMYSVGGGGGGGGGVVLVAANILDNSKGTIEAKGGNGGNAVNGGDAAGGGGGGAGGLIALIYRTHIKGTTNINGGTGGSGVNGGAAGESGGEGRVIEIPAI
jgi:hypothetical protein